MAEDLYKPLPGKPYIKYTSRLWSDTDDGVAVEACQTYDRDQAKFQHDINKEVKESLARIEGIAGSAAAGAYMYKGSLDSFADLLLLKDVKVGDVYNIKTEFELTGELNPGGDKKKYPAGTNVAATKAMATSTADGWDALGGTVDLTKIDNGINLLQNNIIPTFDGIINSITDKRDESVLNPDRILFVRHPPRFIAEKREEGELGTLKYYKNWSGDNVLPSTFYPKFNDGDLRYGLYLNKEDNLLYFFNESEELVLASGLVRDSAIFFGNIQEVFDESKEVPSVLSLRDSIKRYEQIRHHQFLLFEGYVNSAIVEYAAIEKNITFEGRGPIFIWQDTKRQAPTIEDRVFFVKYSVAEKKFYKHWNAVSGVYSEKGITPDGFDVINYYGSEAYKIYDEGEQEYAPYSYFYCVHNHNEDGPEIIVRPGFYRVTVDNVPPIISADDTIHLTLFESVEFAKDEIYEDLNNIQNISAGISSPSTKIYSSKKTDEVINAKIVNVKNDESTDKALSAKATHDAIADATGDVTTLANNTVLIFDGVVDDAEVQMMSATNITAIKWIKAKSQFAALSGGKYYSSWSDTKRPYTLFGLITRNVVYYNSVEEKLYVLNAAGSLVPVTEIQEAQDGSKTAENKALSVKKSYDTFFEKANIAPSYSTSTDTQVLTSKQTHDYVNAEITGVKNNDIKPISTKVSSLESTVLELSDKIGELEKLLKLA